MELHFPSQDLCLLIFGSTPLLGLEHGAQGLGPRLPMDPAAVHLPLISRTALSRVGEQGRCRGLSMLLPSPARTQQR